LFIRGSSPVAFSVAPCNPQRNNDTLLRRYLTDLGRRRAHICQIFFIIEKQVNLVQKHSRVSEKEEELHLKRGAFARRKCKRNLTRCAE
jgi:hypothetical protein